MRVHLRSRGRRRAAAPPSLCADAAAGRRPPRRPTRERRRGAESSAHDATRCYSRYSRQSRTTRAARNRRRVWRRDRRARRTEPPPVTVSANAGTTSAAHEHSPASRAAAAAQHAWRPRKAAMRLFCGGTTRRVGRDLPAETVRRLEGGGVGRLVEKEFGGEQLAARARDVGVERRRARRPPLDPREGERGGVRAARQGQARDANWAGAFGTRGVWDVKNSSSASVAGKNRTRTAAKARPNPNPRRTRRAAGTRRGR